MTPSAQCQSYVSQSSQTLAPLSLFIIDSRKQLHFDASQEFLSLNFGWLNTSKVLPLDCRYSYCGYCIPKSIFQAPVSENSTLNPQNSANWQNLCNWQSSPFRSNLLLIFVLGKRVVCCNAKNEYELIKRLFDMHWGRLCCFWGRNQYNKLWFWFIFFIFQNIYKAERVFAVMNRNKGISSLLESFEGS